MKRKLLRRIWLLIFVLMTMVVSVSATPVAYAVYSDGTLTFKYGEKPNTENVYDMNTGSSMPGWFGWRKLVKTVVFDASFAQARPTSCLYWFYMMENLTSIEGIKNLNTSEVTIMYQMFVDCSGLTSLDVSGFNTSNVTNMGYMFDGCSKLTSLDVSGFNTSNVTNMRSMFSGCSGLTSLDVSGFNTSNVTSMGFMFKDCSSLTSLDVSGFNTSNVTDMYQMFKDCSSLTSLDVSGFNTSNVTDMYQMFRGCSKLKTIYCNDTWHCSSSTDMFYYCPVLKGAISYNLSKTDATYANPETGYFTYKDYDVWVAGTRVTRSNEGDLSGISGVTGTVSYDHFTKTLTLNNATIATTASSTSGIYSKGNLTIKVTGDCNVSSMQSAGIACSGRLLNIEGTGSLSVTGITGISAVSENVENSVNIGGGVNLTVEGTSAYGIIGTVGSGTFYTTINVSGKDTKVRVKGVSQDFFRIKNMTLADGLHIALPTGAYFSSASHTVISDGSAVKNQWAEISTNNYVSRIDITGYTWPSDFEAADYEASTSTTGCKVTDIVYSMFQKTIDMTNPSNVYAGQTVGICFTVELDEGNTFADGVTAYIERDGVTLPHEYKLLGSTDREKRFAWTYTIPTPEGGSYVQTVTESVTAPVAGAEPVWTSENSATTAAAGAKAAEILPEPTVKEKFDRAAAHVVSSIEWVEISTDGLRKMQQGETFQSGKHYGVWFTVVPVSGKQFHEENTEYRINTPTTVTATDIPVPGYTIGNAVVVRQGSQKALLGYIFSLPGDVNGDGYVTMADANAVVNYFLSTDKESITNFDVTSANINGDEDITMADANQIVNGFLSGGTVKHAYNGHEYVDLGLSVKWATCNVGATKPEDYGDYFAWGETEPKIYYNMSTYTLTTDRGSTFTKYTGSDKSVLDAADDAAAANWGDAWRMPTLDEQKELLDNCTWEWQAAGNTEFGGVAGMKVTSKKEGNTDKYIFLPAAGISLGTALRGAGSGGCYWSASLSADRAEDAYVLYVGSGGQDWRNYYRYYGLAVRPVCP